MIGLNFFESRKSNKHEKNTAAYFVMLFMAYAFICANGYL